MKTQKQKYELIRRLENLGFSYNEACQVRRIEMTLHRWTELECGDGNNYRSWAIERDETTDKPFMCIYPHEGKSHRYAVADREKGALKRLAKIMEAHPEFITYQQTDPRGCALYIVNKSDVGGHDLSSVYTRGLAVD